MIARMAAGASALGRNVDRPGWLRLLSSTIAAREGASCLRQAPVIGASGGIGAAVAERLAKDGFTVVVPRSHHSRKHRRVQIRRPRPEADRLP
jgi:shikimate 5-dehydrogenase